LGEVALELDLDEGRMTNDGLRLATRDVIDAVVAPISIAVTPSLEVLLLRRE
jgi:hypothetical protein